MFRIFTLAQKFDEPIDRHLSVSEWPWTWVRVAYYVIRIQQIHERASIMKPDNPDLAVPPRWIMFNEEALETWWKAQRGDVIANDKLGTMG